MDGYDKWMEDGGAATPDPKQCLSLFCSSIYMELRTLEQ